MQRCSGCATRSGSFGRALKSDALAAQADPAEQVYLVPAFVGLGAPYWDAQARGAIYGLTRDAGTAEIARAALESVGYQTRDLLEAMRADWPVASELAVLRVDGGMTASECAMQFLADILGTPVERPVVKETTALGAAYLAGRAAGLCPDLDGFAAQWRLDRRFVPQMSADERARKTGGWKAPFAEPCLLSSPPPPVACGRTSTFHLPLQGEVARRAERRRAGGGKI